MKRGFTLLELIVVIIIIGILATLGFAQYTRMIERSRGAEARQVLGGIRTQLAGTWVELSGGNPPVMPTAGEFTDARAGIGANADQISIACDAANPNAAQYYFSYAITVSTNTGFTATATRCTANGKPPQGLAAGTLVLVTNFQAGTDLWQGNGGY